ALGCWLAGGLLAALAAAVLFADVTWVMPYFRGSPYPHLHRYGHLGSSLGDILVTLAFRPWRWLAVVVTVKKLVYLGALLAPFGFLPLLAPRALAAALPGLALNLMSLDPILVNHRSQYVSFVLPFLARAAVDGGARLQAWSGSQAGDGGGGAPRARLTLAGALAFGLLASVALRSRTVNDLARPRWMPTDGHGALRGLLGRIPPDPSVSTTERLVELGARDAGLERLDDEARLRALESERAEGRDDLPRPTRTDHVGRARARARYRVHPLDEASRRVLGPEDDDAAGQVIEHRRAGAA